MIEDDHAGGEPVRSGVIEEQPLSVPNAAIEPDENARAAGGVIETIVCPFHCLYQDALSFHTQSRLARSESEASRFARAALLLYVWSERPWFGRPRASWAAPELRGILVDPDRPLPLLEAWRLLPAIAAEPGAMCLHSSMTCRPGRSSPSCSRSEIHGPIPDPRTEHGLIMRARPDSDYEPLQAHQVPDELRAVIAPTALPFPSLACLAILTLFAHIISTLAAPSSMRRSRRSIARMGSALTQGKRHRREPVRVVSPPQRDTAR